MDKYDSAHDHYCYAGSATLKNKLNIRDINRLEAAEREITALTIAKISFRSPPYNLEYMQLLHHQLFSDLYEWAGAIRSVDISKGGTRFCVTHHLPP